MFSLLKNELKIALWICCMICCIGGIVFALISLDREYTKARETIFTIEQQNKMQYEQLKQMQDRLNDINTQLMIEQEELKILKKEQDAFFTVKATAYTHNDPGCNKVTALGTTVKENRTLAVDPKVIPLGSKVKVVSNYPGVSGEYVAEDVGGSIKGGRVDIYMPSVSRAMQFGRRDIRIRVLEEK